MRTAALARIGLLFFPLLFPISAFALTGIDTCAELEDMSNDLDGDYLLTADIDCDGIDFTPVGTAATPFTGTFNGSGFTIRNTSILTADDDIGVFGYAQNASIRDVRLENTVVAGISYAGSLVGFADRTDIQNVASSGVILDVIDNAGGLVGMFSRGTMTGAYTVNVTVDNGGGGDQFGGLVGTFSGGLITDVYAQSYTQLDGGNEVGGLIGKMHAGIDTMLRNAYATSLIGASTRVGGLVGYVSHATGFAGTCLLQNVFVSTDVNAGFAFGALVGQQKSGCTTDNGWFHGDPSICVDQDAGTTDCTEADYVSDLYENANEPLASWNFSDTWLEHADTFPTFLWSDTEPPDSVTGLSASVSGKDVTLMWTRPAISDFHSVTIRRGTGGYPATQTGGTAVAVDFVPLVYTDADLADGTYYYSVFTRDIAGNFSVAAQVSATVSTAVSSSSSASAFQTDTPHGGGRRGNAGRAVAVPARSDAAQATAPQAIPREDVQKPSQIRICARVMKWFKGNEKMLGRVNMRLEKWFGFTC